MITNPPDRGGFPEPPAAALAISDRLRALIADRISTAGGSIPFQDYMNAVLNEPSLGYYAANVQGFGPAADFVTAPELSDAFAHSLAHALAPVLAALGPRAGVLELGAGSGVLAESLLESLARRSALPAHYTILEPSPVLGAMQRERLAPLAGQLGVDVRWLERLPRHPITGVIVANEVVDAFPVERFQVTTNGPRPVHVAFGEAGFEERLGPRPRELGNWLAALEARLGWEFPPGYTSERNPLADAWIASLADVLHVGAVFVFDYGYEEREFYHPERAEGTLLCHYRHRVHADPYYLPGLQDVTASVDFSALARSAGRAGLSVAAYTTQAWFLMGNDLEGWIAAETPGTSAYVARAREVRMLTMPGEMGERVKLLALAKGSECDGVFDQARDLRSRL